MSHYNVKPVRLDFKPSLLLAMIMAFVATAACVIVIGLPVDLRLKVAVCPIILLASAYQIAGHGLLRLSSSAKILILDSKGELKLHDQSGNEQGITVLPSSFVSSYMTIVNYRLAGSSSARSLILVPDNVDPQAFRQFRVWLRWSRHAISVEDDAAA